MNSVNLTGRLTDDVILSKAGQHTVTSFTLAVSRGKKAEGQPDADFIRCVAWNRTAEILRDYTSKGSQIGVTAGRIQTRTYEDKEGKKVYVTEVVADRIELLGSKKENNQQAPKKQEQKTDKYGMPEGDLLDIQSDELPF